MFRKIPDDEAEATVDAVWQQGTRYFDTAPFYGAGLSEDRINQHQRRRTRGDDDSDAGAQLPSRS